MNPILSSDSQLDAVRHSGSRAFQCFEKSSRYCIKASSYFPVYDKIFSSYVGKKITFVEIGIAYGGSLQMWREYFGADARIIGVDLYPETPGDSKPKREAKEGLEKEGFEIHEGDQGDPEFWRVFFDKVGKVDIILDDGSHYFNEQIVTTECTVDHIKDGGMLVVEDVWSSFAREAGGPSRNSFFAYACNRAKGLQYRLGKFARPQHREGAIPHRRVRYDSAVYAINFYQSIVVFEIDRRLCDLGLHCMNMPYPFFPPKGLRHKLRHKLSYLVDSAREIFRNQFLGKYFKY